MEARIVLLLLVAGIVVDSMTVTDVDDLDPEFARCMIPSPILPDSFPDGLDLRREMMKIREHRCVGEMEEIVDRIQGELTALVSRGLERVRIEILKSSYPHITHEHMESLLTDLRKRNLYVGKSGCGNCAAGYSYSPFKITISLIPFDATEFSDESKMELHWGIQ
jgi:hypothetical protein